MEYGFDRLLDIDLRQAFKDCKIDYDTFNSFSIPKTVVKRIAQIEDNRADAMIKAGLIPGSRF